MLSQQSINMSYEFKGIRIVGYNLEATTVSPNAPGLRLMPLELSESPSRVWAEMFKEERRFPKHSMWRHAEVKRDAIVVECAPEELPRLLEDLKENVSAVNEKYRQYVKKVEQHEEAEQRRRQEELDRLKKVKDSLKFD